MPAPLCLVGPTASGKTALAVALARALGRTELVSVDAMAVYRGLDIGTAKPSPAEREGLVWHGLDLVDPGEEFSVAAFQDEIQRALATIAARGHRAVLVGGTGLYHRAVVDGLRFPGRYPLVRRALEQRADREGLAGLYAELAALDPLAASRTEATNRRRIVRALEVVLGSGERFSAAGEGLAAYAPSPFVLVGLRIERAELDARIAARLAAQLEAGFLAEVELLARRPGGLSRTARQALGYRELLGYLAGETTYEEALERIAQRTRALARRQESWFRRDPRIIWLEAVAPAARLVERLVAIARDPVRRGGEVVGE